MANLRTPETKKKYEEFKLTSEFNDVCQLCIKESLKSFNHWKIIDNTFPYDLIAKTHHMIVPIRHISEYELSNEEILEYKEIKEKILNSDYDYIFEATTKNKSIPEHYHLHLIISSQ